MKALVLAALLLTLGSAYAQQQEVLFQPPVPHDVQRYETGWNKNPFTLKTAPTLVEAASFARDLVIGACYGDSADPTIIIVNAKTNKRTSLRKSRPSPNGMRLGKVTLGAGRKDVMVEVTLGAETAVIRYDDAYIRQMAAAETARPAASPQPHSPQGRGAASGASVSASPAVQNASAHSGLASHGAMRDAGNPSAAAEGTRSEPLGSRAAGSNGSSPVSSRRRLITPVLNATAISQ